MKKYLYSAIFLTIAYFIFKDDIAKFINHLFFYSVIPYSWFTVRLLIGVVAVVSISATITMSNRGWFGTFMACILIIPALIIFYWFLMHFIGMLNYSQYNFNVMNWVAWWVISGGITAWIVVVESRGITAKITRWIDRKTSRGINLVEDTEIIFKNHDMIKTKPYNPETFYKYKDGLVFMSLDVKGKPIYCDYASFIKKSHGNSMGKSQAGKNVAIQNIVVQLMYYDEFIVMCDAKDGGDDVMAPVLWKYANKYEKPYNYIELSLTAPEQLNILQIKDADFIKKILMQLAKLEETEDMAVSYHIQKDDATAQKIALFVARSQEEVTIYDLVTKHWQLFFDPKAKEQTSLQTALIKLSYKPCINAKNGALYEDIIKAGGCLYVQAKTKDENVILSVIISSLRFVKSQQRISRVVTIIGDEFMKYASQDFIDIFTEGAGKGFKLITAYQTSALLEVKSIGKTSEQMLSVIMSNNSYEYIYGTRDPLVLSVFEEHYSGTKITHEETKNAETSIVLADKGTGEKHLKKVLTARYPKELLSKLRTGEHFLYRSGELLDLCYNGYLPLMTGEFNKDSDEFVEMVNASRKLTLSAESAIAKSVGYSNLSQMTKEEPEAVKTVQEEQGEYNPFA